jgi:tetratricopeptide (TPR) repeat protein
MTFGPFVLDMDAERLLRDGCDVPLRRQALRTLRVLVCRGGRGVSQEQLMAEAWSGIHVSGHTVDVTISEIRKALGDCGRWITRRRGMYRLLVPRSDALIALGRHVSGHHTRDGLRHGLECFVEAAAHAPFDHRAFVGQCACHLSLVSLGLSDGLTGWDHFRAAHARAVALVGPSALRADHALALFLCRREIDGAELEFRRALADEPSEPMTCVRMMAVEVARGNLDAALGWATRASAAGPLVAIAATALIAIHVWRREYAIAESVGREAVRVHPHFALAHVFYGMALQCSGRLHEALVRYQIASVLSPDVPWTRALEASCLIRLGESRAAAAIADELLDRRRHEYIDSVALAHIRVARGETTRAIEDLAQAMDEMNGRWYTLACDPFLDDLRTHRSFQALWADRFGRRLQHVPA